MTHDGRMARGEANVKANILLDNADTKYFLDNKPKEVKKDDKRNSKSKSSSSS